MKKSFFVLLYVSCFPAFRFLKAHVNADVKPGVNGIRQFQNPKEKAGRNEGNFMMFTCISALLIAERKVGSETIKSLTPLHFGKIRLISNKTAF